MKTCWNYQNFANDAFDDQVVVEKEFRLFEKKMLLIRGNEKLVNKALRITRALVVLKRAREKVKQRTQMKK